MENPAGDSESELPRLDFDRLVGGEEASDTDRGHGRRPQPLASLRPVIIAAPLAPALVALISAMPTVEKTLNAWRAERGNAAPVAIVVEPPSAVSADRLAGRDTDADYRIDSNLEALRLWWERLLPGRGLGSFLWSQGREVRFDGFRPTIHNSLPWILAEMGTVGAIAFPGFFSPVPARALAQPRGRPGRRPAFAPRRLPDADPARRHVPYHRDSLSTARLVSARLAPGRIPGRQGRHRTR